LKVEIIDQSSRSHEAKKITGGKHVGYALTLRGKTQARLAKRKPELKLQISNSERYFLC